MSKKVIIFTGLSISPEEASTIVEADYRAPVKRNDILQAITDKPDIIGIIDGGQVRYQLPNDFLTRNKKHIAIVKDSNFYPQALKKCVYDIVRDIVEKENSYAKHLKKHKDYEIILD